jgi:hypothetical protein
VDEFNLPFVETIGAGGCDKLNHRIYAQPQSFAAESWLYVIFAVGVNEFMRLRTILPRISSQASKLCRRELAVK